MKKILRTLSFRQAFLQRIRFRPELYTLFFIQFDLFLKGDTEKTHPHILKGNMNGLKAFSINADVRVIYKEEKNLIILIDIGTHKEVYGKK